MTTPENSKPATELPTLNTAHLAQIHLALCAVLFQAVLLRMAIMTGKGQQLTATELDLREATKDLVARVREVYNSPHDSDEARFRAIMTFVAKEIEQKAAGIVGVQQRTTPGVVVPSRGLLGPDGKPVRPA